MVQFSYVTVAVCLKTSAKKPCGINCDGAQSVSTLPDSVSSFVGSARKALLSVSSSKMRIGKERWKFLGVDWHLGSAFRFDFLIYRIYAALVAALSLLLFREHKVWPILCVCTVHHTQSIFKQSLANLL